MQSPRTNLLLAFAFMICILACKSTDSPNNQETSISFTKHIVHDAFISEGVAVADVNNDGKDDILADAYWFEAPDWQKHEIRTPESYDPATSYSKTFLNYTTDVNQDGRIDLIRIHSPGEEVLWYENPKDLKDHWEEHFIDSSACNESPMFIDIDDNDRMDLVFGHEKTGEMMWLRSPDTPGETEWEAIPISAPNSPGTERYSHGLGFQDINGDGRRDIIVREGWYEKPENPRNTPWTFHEANLGEKCSQIYTYDFDKDGDLDVISASAHDYGIWWHENISKDASQFTRHLIDSSFSQTHGAAFEDINDDGLPDLITGKRYFAHNGNDPGGNEAAVLYWFELQIDKKNNPSWVPHLIDDNSGVGLHVVIHDLNGDGKLDIINSNKKGVIYFLQE